jgi:hypothetical protein
MKLMQMVSVGPVVVGIEVVEVVGVDIGVVRVDRMMVAEVELLGTRSSVDRGGSSSGPCRRGVVRSSSRKGQRSHVAYSRRGHQGGICTNHFALLSIKLSPGHPSRVTAIPDPPCDIVFLGSPLFFL